MNSRLYNCLKVFDILLREASSRGISKVLLNGDLFEENAYIDVEVYDAVYRKMEKLYREGLEIIINLGNHDILQESGKRVLHSLRPFRRIAKVIEEPKSVWNYLSVIPYDSNPENIKKAIRECSSGRKYALVLHCGVQGAKTGPTAYLVRNPIKLADIRADHFGLVLLSDFHLRQQLAENVFYLGSPLQHSFGETHKPAIWDIRILDVAPWFRADKIYTNLPQFRRVRVENARDLKEKLKSFSSDYVRIVLPSNSKVLDVEIEKLAHEKFLYEIEREGEKKEINMKNVNTLSPEEAIEKFVKGHAKRNTDRLTQLGYKLYRGEI